MSDKLYKLSNFILEFSQFRTNDDKTRIGCHSIDNSLFVSTRKGENILNQCMSFVQIVSIIILIKMILIPKINFFNNWGTKFYCTEI